MAEGGQPQLVEDKNRLTCGICLEQYKEPKILPCSHTFCLGCLEKTLKTKEESQAKALEGQTKVLESHEEEQDGDCEYSGEAEVEVSCAVRVVQRQKISCPVCKREHEVPWGGVGHFHDDLEAVQTIEYELLQKSLTSKLKMSQKCGSCLKERTITNHCDECNGICQKCSDAHEEFFVFAKHKVVPITDLTPDSLGLKKRKTHSCGRHGEALTTYCTSCSQVICHVCIIKQHQNHTLSLLKEADEKLQERVGRQSKEVQQTQKVFEEYRKYIAGVDREMVGESYTEKLKTKVNSEFDERIKRLQDERECLVRKIDSYDSLSKKQVWSEKNTVELVLNKIEAGLRMTKKAERCVNPADRIAMNSEGSKILNEVSKATWSHKSLPYPLVFRKSHESVKKLSSDYPLIFQRSPKPVKQLSLSSDHQSPCGELAPITEDDMTVSVVDENGRKVLTPEVGQPTILEVNFKVVMVDEPKFQILYGKSRQPLESMAAYEIPDSTSWNIEFVPRCAGTHFIQIWLGGLAIAIKDVSISGKPKVGSKVQPGPDWTPPADDTMLYLVGTVTYAGLSSIEVDWRQGGGAEEDRRSPPFLVQVEEDMGEVTGVEGMEMAVGEEELVAAVYAPAPEPEADDSVPVPGDVFEITDIQASDITKLNDAETGEVLEATGISLEADESSQEPELEEYEPRRKYVHKRHQWGGFDGKYEVELFL